MVKTTLYDRTCFCCAVAKFYKKSGCQFDFLAIQSEEARIVLRNYRERFIKLLEGKFIKSQGQRSKLLGH